MPVQPFESVTITVIGNVPDCVGVPESKPELDKPKPAGKLPEDNVKVAVPTAPVWLKLWLNGASTVPVFTPGLVTVIVWQLIVRLYVAPLPVQPFASVTVTTIGKVPACVGVPESNPDVDKVNPAGKVEDVVNVVVPIPLLCPNCSLKGELTVPVLFAGLVTMMLWQGIVIVTVAVPFGA